LEFTNVDINHAIREVLPLLRGELENGGVLLRVDLFAGDRPVLADPIQLQQVLINLIRNAVEVMMTIIDGPQVLRIFAQTTEDEMRRLYQSRIPGRDWTRGSPIAFLSRCSLQSSMGWGFRSADRKIRSGSPSRNALVKSDRLAFG
jgi:hypothetical protein